MREQAVRGADVDDAAAAKETSDAAAHFPGFVELLAGQTSGAADRPREPVEQCVAGRPIEIASGRAAARRERKKPYGTSAGRRNSHRCSSLVSRVASRPAIDSSDPAER